MPRQLITHPEATRDRSLGWLAVWWIETFVVQGPGDVEGEPIRHGDEFTGFLVDCYALGEDGRRLIDSAFFSRPKGCNKSGLAAELVLFEALGPCRFAGWAKGGEKYSFLGQTYTYAKGEPMGKPVKYPFVRIMATEDGQTGNVFDMVYNNLEDGPLSDFKAYGMRVNRAKIDLPFGGEIIPSTAGAASKDGGKETFVVFDESHLYITKGLKQMYSTVTRNLNKRKKIAETWALETTTMYLPGEDSIAEETYKYAQMIWESTRTLNAGEKRKVKVKRARLLFDHRWGEIKSEDMSDEEKLTQAIEDAYGEALEWNSQQGIVDDLFDPRRSETEARRYFLNTITGHEDAWLQPSEVDAVMAHGEDLSYDAVKDGKEGRSSVWATGGGKVRITLGFDGAITNDATALMGCRVSDGALFVVRIEEQPDGPEAKDWVVDFQAFDAAVSRAHADFEVVGFFADPPHWQDYVDKWNREWGDTYKVKAMGTSAIRWWTKRDIPMALALERLRQAVGFVAIKVENHPVLKRHLYNARVEERRGGTVIRKDTKNSVKKIDAAMGSTLAYEARAQFLAESPVEEPTFVPRRAR